MKEIKLDEVLIKSQIEQVITFFAFDIVPLISDVKLREAKVNVVRAIIKIIKEGK